MRLFEAIIDANHRAVAGDTTAGIRPADFADALPVVGLICIDPRLDPLIPEVMGLLEDQFLCLRTPGNIVPSPTSDVVRALALACAVKHAAELVIVGHTDCTVRKTSVMELTERFRALGVDRSRLPDNLTEYFGLFASERQNVIRAVELVRASSLISPNIPVHGLLVDIETGRLEWLVNGYQAQPTSPPGLAEPAQSVAGTLTSAQMEPSELRLAAPSLAVNPEPAGGKPAQLVPPATPSSASEPAAAPSSPPAPSKPPPIPPPIPRPLRPHQSWRKEPLR